MATVSRENVGMLTDKITVQLSKNDYYPAFEKALKNYSKQAKIPGFRPGMVPMGIVKKMYGANVFTDEVLRTVEKEINSFLEQEKPEILGQPLPTDDNGDVVSKLDVNQPGDYTFNFEIGLKPQYTVADLKGATITRKKVDVTDSMLSEEISRLQSRHGNVTELDAIAADNNMLNLNFDELDASGAELEGGAKAETSILLSAFSEAVRPQLAGLKVNDSIVVTLGEAFTGKDYDFAINELSLKENADAASLKFRVTITKISVVEPRELNEEFFGQLYPGKAIATEAEFKEALKADIESYWAGQSRGQVHDEIYHYLIDNTAVQFPEPFLKRWIQNTGEKPKTAEEVETEFPAFLNSLKWSIISDDLIKTSGTNVQPDELRAFAKQQMMGYMGVTTLDDSTAWLDAYVDRMMSDKKYIDQTYNQVLTDKMFSWAEAQVSNYQEKLVSVDQFVSEQHHHHY